MNRAALLGAGGLAVMAGGISLMATRGRSGVEIGAWTAVWVALLGANGYLAWRRRNA